MKKLSLGLVGAALAIGSVAATRIGGWAVVSVDNMPEYFVAGKPLVLTFAVRQHGQSPLEGLKPSIRAKSGSKVVEGRAWELPAAGNYRATLTVPQTGDWDITIESGFGASKGKLLPLRAVDSTQKIVALHAADRGRQLFAAKGCVTCHVHRAVDIDAMLKDFGPELSDKRFAPDYLAKFLADPTIKPQAPNKPTMPNPVLRENEIVSLVAFINSERRLSSR
jgi:cytochrome c551/c552